MTNGRCQRTDEGRQMTESRRLRTDDGERLNSEGGRLKEVKAQGSKLKGKKMAKS